MTTALALAVLAFPHAQASADGNVFIPESSIRRPADAGIRAHTNHLIYVGPARPQVPDPSLTELLHGPAARLTDPFPNGYAPSDMHAAYNIPSIGGSGAIAIIDAYHFASSLKDFNVFSKMYNLPQETSSKSTTSTNKVFQVVYQGANQPASDASWGQEEALDIEWAHAMSRNAKIYLVEANSASISDLFACVQKANTLPGVREVSMSFGTDEFSGELSFDSIFTTPGIVYFAAAGDVAAAPQYPSLSPNVVGVGGTTLTLTTADRVVSETVWDGTGGGLSVYEPIPAYQASVSSLLGNFRGAPDIGLDADPNTGCAVYDSTAYQGFSGWLVFGGTSLSTPCIAGIANTCGHRYASSVQELTHIYGGLGLYYRDIILGASGSQPGRIGWDFCTGVGVPVRTSGL